LRGAAVTDYSRFYAELGRQIQVKRDKAGLTQQALASLVGLSRASIANVERGKQRLMLDTYLDLAAALKVAPAELLPDVSTSGSTKLLKLLKGRPRGEQEWIKSAIGSLD
jgi:transcriptional regulator with XRE-family HTH domain